MGTTKLDAALTDRAHDELPQEMCTRCKIHPQYDGATSLCGFCDIVTVNPLIREADRQTAERAKKVEVDPRLTLPIDSASRKAIPLAAVLDYFPAALAEVAKLIKSGNDKHNPGQPLHWARDKSMDHEHCVIKHFVDRGLVDPDSPIGQTHTVSLVWRALAMLQLECEQQGAPMSRGSR